MYDEIPLNLTYHVDINQILFQHLVVLFLPKCNATFQHLKVSFEIQYSIGLPSQLRRHILPKGLNDSLLLFDFYHKLAQRYQV